MDGGTAFDAVMNHHPVAAISMGPHSLNFLELQKNARTISSFKELERNYSRNIGLNVSTHIIFAYYDFNIITGLTKIDGVKTVLEIGAGNGNLASLIYSNLRKQIIIVDLPRTLCVAITFLSSLFPEAKMILPHEANTQLLGDADFVFLTPGQIHLIPDSSIELAINTSSFQEMTYPQIKEYFALIERACTDDGYFYTRNRVEKLPDENIPQKGTTEPVIRFSEYPWNCNNRILVYEICRLFRLTQRAVYVRLEQIRK